MMLEHADAATLVGYAILTKKPFPEAESEIAESAFLSYQYAVEVLHDRFLAGESAISHNPQWARMYRDFLADLEFERQSA
jgi:hypothetical protein